MPERIIDFNADMGEGYGPWRMGDDAAMLTEDWRPRTPRPAVAVPLSLAGQLQYIRVRMIDRLEAIDNRAAHQGHTAGL